MKTSIWLIISLGFILSTAALEEITAQNIANIFNIDSSCNQFRQGGYPDLQTFANEAANMANAGLQMVEVADTAGAPGEAAKSYLLGFFSTMTTDTQYAQIRSVYQSVYDLLVGPITMPGGNRHKASLFCDDSGWTIVNRDSIAKQSDGSPVDLSGNPEEPATVGDLYGDLIDKYENRHGGQVPLIFEIKLPVTPARYIYTFRNKYIKQPPTTEIGPQPEPPLNVCANQGMSATTYKAQFLGSAKNVPPYDYPVIVFCPTSFTFNGQKSGQGATSLGSVAPVVVDPGSTNTPQTLAQLQPYSATLLHEMFHFAPWDPTMQAINIVDKSQILKKSNGKLYQSYPYSLNDCLQYKQQNSIQNAQSYVWMAIGAWYTYFKPLSDGTLVTYAAGEARKL